MYRATFELNAKLAKARSNPDTIEYRAALFLTDVFSQHAQNQKTLFTEDELIQILIDAYTFAGSENPEVKVKAYVWPRYALKDGWFVLA